MRAILVAILFLIGALPRWAFAQGTVVNDDRLPPASIELKRNDPLATSTPWQLPKPGDAEKEAQIKKESAAKSKATNHGLVRVFERGVFTGYETLRWGGPRERSAKVLNDAFTPNTKLPPDVVELSSSARPDKSDYFPARPKTRPWNVPEDNVAVKVFHRGKLIGWTFMSKEAVAMLHKPGKT